MKMITIKEAAAKANVTVGTIRHWAKDFKIGYKVGGRWSVFDDGLQKVMSGELHYSYKHEKNGRKVNKIYGASDEKVG